MFFLIFFSFLNLVSSFLLITANGVLDAYLGAKPETFEVDGKTYDGNTGEHYGNDYGNNFSGVIALAEALKVNTSLSSVRWNVSDPHPIPTASLCA